MQKAHEEALERYFDGEKARVERFLSEEWEPLFLKNFLAKSRILEDLQQPFRIGGQDKERLSLLLADYLDDETEARQAAERVVAALGPARQGEKQIIRKVLDDFIEQEYLDQATLDIYSQLGSDEAARMIFEFTEDAHREMLAQREAMLAPIAQTRVEALDELRGYYAETIQGQNLLTARLGAAAQLQVTQQELVDLVAGEGAAQRVQDITTQFSNKVTRFMETLRQQADRPVGDIASEIFD